MSDLLREVLTLALAITGLKSGYDRLVGLSLQAAKNGKSLKIPGGEEQPYRNYHNPENNFDLLGLRPNDGREICKNGVSSAVRYGRCWKAIASIFVVQPS